MISAIPEWLTTDLDDNARIYGARVDIGAYEYQDSPAASRETPSAVVTTLSDTIDLYDGLISLRETLFYLQSEAIDETITFDSTLDGGTILLTNGELTLNRPVTIDASLLSSLTIDANHESRVISINGDDVTLDSLTIVNGLAEEGGGILNYGSLTILNSVITQNATENEYCSGGGIYNSGTLSVVNSTILNNTASYAGGGIYNDYDATLNIASSVISSNQVVGESNGLGGGIYNGCDATLNITHSMVYGNQATGEYNGQGGGIFNECYAILNLVNSAISGNFATGEGGGILSSEDTILNITNSTISGNTAENGGGVYAYMYDEQWNKEPGSFTLANSIIALNTATSNLNYYGNLTTESSNNLVDIDPIFICNPSDGGDGWGDDLETTEIDESANDDFGDLRLSSNSPAIDAGNNSQILA